MRNWFKKIGSSLIKKDPANADPKTKVKKEAEPKIIQPVPSDQKIQVKKEAEPKIIQPVPSDPKPKNTWFNKLGINFRKTSENIKKALLSKKLGQKELADLEESLISSDLGVEFTYSLLDEIKSKNIEEESVRKTISNFLVTELQAVNHNFSFKKKHIPQVILVYGVNGSGKTTTIAKLANKAKKESIKTKIVAADTFRAAAVEQLVEWGTRIGIEVITGESNEDPASVVFKAHRQSIEEKTELLIIDTAGRLHNKIELMEELKKILRVIEKNDPTAPHEKILVLDSTIGQNTYTQIEAFKKLIGVNGIIMTKLDGSSKGGSLIGICKKYKLPIYAIGLGEKVDDLIAFNPQEFVDTLLGTNFGDKNESLH